MVLLLLFLREKIVKSCCTYKTEQNNSIIFKKIQILERPDLFRAGLDFVADHMDLFVNYYI